MKQEEFMSKLQLEESKEQDEEEVLLVESCNLKEEPHESCLMVLHLGSSSEEDLFFPGDSEPEPTMLPQHHNDYEASSQSLKGINKDSEETTLSEGSESDEVVHVEFRSGRVLPPPAKKGTTGKDKYKSIDINEDILLKDLRKKSKPDRKIDYNILSHLRKIPAQLSLYEALLMSKDLRDTLIQALKDPEKYEVYFAERYMTEVLQTQSLPAVMFSEEDLLLGTPEHNRPLYVTAESDGVIIRRIFIDPCSSMNLMSLRALRSLSLDIHHLGRVSLMVHGFNERGQKILGSFILPLRFGELYTKAKFHVIDVDTSFKALLGRPWLHEYGIVPSTLHQCLKYLRDKQEYMIPGDIQPFAHEVKIYEDAKYFIPKDPKLQSSAHNVASASKTLKSPKGGKKQRGRKKATPTPPKANIAPPMRERRAIRLGSDTEEDIPTQIYEDAKYFIPKDPKLQSSAHNVASASKTVKLPKGGKKQRGRKKATPTPPKAAIAPPMRERRAIRLGSDTEEDIPTQIYEDAKYFIPKDPKLQSSAHNVASASKTVKSPKGGKKQRGRKKATPTPPKAAIAPPMRERRAIRLGSDTEEDIPTQIYEDAMYFIPKDPKLQSSAHNVASASKTVKSPKGGKKQRGRKKATPTPPKATIAPPMRERRAIRLGSDTEEDIPTQIRRYPHPN